VAAQLMGFDIERLPIVSHAFDVHPLPIGATPIDRLACFDERVGAEIPVVEVQPAVPGGFRPQSGWPNVGRGAMHTGRAPQPQDRP
jgi:hypothetical protein